LTPPKKILVTGGTGYIGSHTVVELLDKGYEVYIIDNLSNSREEVLTGIEKITGKIPHFFEFDLLENKKVLDFFTENKPDAVIHFAALKAVGDSVQMPLEYYENNLISLFNLIKACKANKTKHFVFSSSCSVYGEPDSLPINEKAVRKTAESPYGNSKKMCEDVLQDVSKIDEIKAIVLRYFNPVGAHSSAAIGEYPLGSPNNLMPVITQTAIGKRQSFQVFGNDYDTPDGTCIRDYIHVVDLAQAHVVALERLIGQRNNAAYEIFNLGTGKGISVKQMIEAFEHVTGQRLNYEIAPRRAGDVVKVYADTSLANAVLGWQAKLGLDDMIRSAWAWEQQLAKAEGIRH